MRVVERAVNASAHRRHHHHRQVPIAARRQVRVARDLEQIDRVERVVAELNLTDRLLPRHRQAHRSADDPALIERRIPRGAQALRRGEDTSKRRAHILAEDVGHTEMRLANVERQADGLNHGCHGRVVSTADARAGSGSEMTRDVIGC